MRYYCFHMRSRGLGVGVRYQVCKIVLVLADALHAVVVLEELRALACRLRPRDLISKHLYFINLVQGNSAHIMIFISNFKVNV